MKRLFLLMVIFLISCGPDVDILQTILVLPSEVELIFPENNSECTAGIIISETESEVIFEWSAAEVTDGYRVSLVNLTSGEEVFFDATENSLPIRLLRGTPYEWYVATFLNNSDETIQSNTEVFYNAGPGIESFIPFPATNVSPINGEVFESTTTAITLQWTSEDLDNDIVAYDVYFSSNNPPELFATDLNTTSLSNLTIMSGTEYFWKVVTRDQNGNESISDTFTFNVAD